MCVCSTDVMGEIRYIPICLIIFTLVTSYLNTSFYIPGLFYVDDGLVLAQTEGELEIAIDALERAVLDCGLRLNKEKCKILIFNKKQIPNEIAGIKTVFMGIIRDKIEKYILKS